MPTASDEDDKAKLLADGQTKGAQLIDGFPDGVLLVRIRGCLDVLEFAQRELAFHVLNRSVARLTLFEKQAD